MAELRRREIDLLEWSVLDFERGLIRVQATEFFQLKSQESPGDVEGAPEVLAVFQNHRKRSTGQFVIELENPPRPAANYSHHRCRKDVDAVTAWLCEKGVRSKTPLHAMRKEFGSLLCERGGIYEASRALRHADIRTTSAHYLDKKRRITVGLGGLLTKDNTSRCRTSNPRLQGRSLLATCAPSVVVGDENAELVFIGRMKKVSRVCEQTLDRL